MATHVKTTDIVRIKESVSDFISLIDPTDTPFLSSVGSEKIKSTKHEWLEDTLREVADNAKAEGHTYVETERDQPQFVENYTQILSETFRVSGTADAVDAFGRKTETARETMKTGKLLKMDFEHGLVGTAQEGVPRTTGTTVSKFKSVQALISPDTTLDITSPNATPSVLTEDDIVDAHELLYNAGSDAEILMVRPSLTKVISNFVEKSARTMELGNDSKSLTHVISVYTSSFGTLKVVKNRRIRASDALLYTPSNWKILILRDWFREKLAKLSDSEAWAMTGEFSLKHVNRKSSAIIKGIGLTT